jgi:siroheme synthase
MTQDRNDEIRALINSRLELGRQRYGHGVRPNDDTRQWGTKEDSWAEMALEEALDLTIYLCAELLRVQDQRRELQLITAEKLLEANDLEEDSIVRYLVERLRDKSREVREKEDEILTLRERLSKYE